MEALLNRVTARFPWMTIGRLLAASFAAALLIVFALPDAHLVAMVVTIAALVGAAAAILCGLTFWGQARVRIARFLNARNLPFRYKVVRRNAAVVAVAGLSLLAVKEIAVARRGAPTPDDIVRNRLAQTPRERAAAVPANNPLSFKTNRKNNSPFR